MLTQLAKKKLDSVIAEACEAQFKLEFTPSTTAELASSLIFLDEIQERVRFQQNQDKLFKISSTSLLFPFYLSLVFDFLCLTPSY